MSLLVIILMCVILLKLSFLGSMTLLFIDYVIILVLNDMVLNLNVGLRDYFSCGIMIILRFQALSFKC
jgi:hypothetical protein